MPAVGLRSFSFADGIIERRHDENGLSWLRLRDGAVLVGDEAELDAEALGILIPLDDDWPIRIAAADRLRRRLIERTADSPLTRQRRKRLTHALRTIDGRRNGASYRAVATVFFGARRVTNEPWKTSSLKAQVARLAAHGRMLISHGYRTLLSGNSSRSAAYRDR